ncbi:histone-like nucleoid-structuring protein Lsr2 [Streptomyces sp. NPDC020489]|uniref:WhiB family transcriptional regulator n=1 Tax=Streptomyces sp. NPDC020489 TaxID=3365077 RepID=UPI003787B299
MSAARPPREDVAELLRAGHTYASIKAELGVSSHTISAIRRAREIPTPDSGPGRRPSPERRAEIERHTVALLRAGASYNEIKAQVGISAPTIVRIRREAKIPAPSRTGARPARSTADALTTYIEPYGAEHSRWTGPWAGRMPQLFAEGRRFNARHVVFERHHGRPPVGYVRSTCVDLPCMTGAHLADTLRGRAMKDLLSARARGAASRTSRKPSHMSLQWQDRAACAGEDLELFFSRSAADRANAVAICHDCPVRAECLYEQLQYETADGRYGVFGGLTAADRQHLPALPASPTAALTVLRQHLAEQTPAAPDQRGKPVTVQALKNLLSEIDEQGGPQAARDNRLHLTPLTDSETVMPTTDPAPALADVLPLEQLLAWGDSHPDSSAQDQAVRARAAVEGLRARHSADQKLSAITDEAAQLEKRLAELRAREAELAPKKTRRKSSSAARDYDTRTVRAWAAEHGVDCPRVGQIPKRVLDAWRTANSSAGGDA